MSNHASMQQQEMANQIIAALLMGNNDMDYTTALAASINEENAYKNVLSQEEIDALLQSVDQVENEDSTSIH